LVEESAVGQLDIAFRIARRVIRAGFGRLESEGFPRVCQ
jgi:hypothetical protein